MARIERDTESPSRAMSHFTDRENFQDVFLRYLFSSSRAPVLSFYGVGGAGKTWLLHKLRSLVPAEMPIAFLDFDRAGDGRQYALNRAAGLQAIRNELGVSCPRFDFALNLMLYKQGVRDEKSLLLEIASEVASFAGTKGLTETATSAAQLVAGVSVSAVPGAAAVLKLFSKPLLEKLKGTDLERRLCRKEIQDLLQDFRAKSAQEIGNELIACLRDDLRENLPIHLNRAVSAVIFLDTFEAVSSDLQNEQHRHQSEEWIRSLASEIDFVLVVIAGQNKLNWDVVDPIWSTELNQHLVGGLSLQDARLLLSHCGITSMPLQNAILSTARESENSFHCYSLGLCADIVYTDRKHHVETSPESMKLTPGNWGELARRFIKSLGTSAIVPWITRLATTPRFDEHAAKQAFSEHTAPPRMPHGKICCATASWRNSSARTVGIPSVSRCARHSLFNYPARKKLHGTTGGGRTIGRIGRQRPLTIAPLSPGTITTASNQRRPYSAGTA